MKLTRRFAVYAAAALVAAASFTFLFVRSEAIHRAQEAASFRAKFIADAILHDHLRPVDLRTPARGRRLRELDKLFHQEILIGGSLGAYIYGPDGRIVYSTDHALMGTAPADPSKLAAAQRGALVSGLMTLRDGGPKHHTDVLETYVPLVLRPGGPGGVFELFEQYSPIAHSAEQLFVPLTAATGAVLLALYGSFFPILRRVTRRIRNQMEEMEHHAFHDTLTGLPNRALFQDRVEQALHRALRESATVAVMVLDLDRFKEINDTFGHQSGDQLLREVAVNVRKPLRDSDTVARLGGDEFAILAPTVAGPMGAIALAERIHAELHRSHEIAGFEVDVDGSIGIALYPHHGRDADALLRCADIALYVSKDCGRPTLFALDQDHHSAERLALGAQLRRAVTQREITVYYQPKADFATGQVTSVEALVRWEHADRGVLLPDQFMPLAEHAGLIRALTSLVLDTALEQCRKWQREGLDLALAVNVTGQDLLDLRFADEVKGLLWKWDVEPSRLELEITESTVLTDPARARAVLQVLSELGVRLAIDDFGSGNSSLGHLRKLPIDVLKIDKSFVMQMHANDDDAVIVRSTIELGHNLGLKVVAEGVESAATWDRLRLLGCDFAQGYYLSRPVPGHKIAKLLAQPEHGASVRRARSQG